MKETDAKPSGNITGLRDTESTRKWINQTMKGIHAKMVELFCIDFRYFRDIRIVKQPDILRRLTRRMRNNLRKNGVIYSNSEWQQVFESLSETALAGFFGNITHYSPEDDILYISQKMITEHPERVIPVCTHELSEKLLYACLPSTHSTPSYFAAQTFAEAKRTDDSTRLNDLLKMSKGLILKNAFKEGVCEAIALQTLRQTGFKAEIAALEQELETGHSKYVDVLSHLGKTTRSTGKDLAGEKRKRQVTDGKKLIEETLVSFQVMKGISYYVGYPLAKAVLEEYGMKGVKVALEKCPPDKAEYFSNTQAYLTMLEKTKPIQQGR